MSYNLLKKSLYPLVLLPILLSATPIAPSNLTLKAESPSSVQLSWHDNSDNELGFKIFRDGLLIDQVAADVTTYLDNGLAANTSYTYTIKSTDNTIDERPVLSGIHINEIVASNVDIEVDPDLYEFSDYIELRNYEGQSVDIGGYTISDDKATWAIPAGTRISANGYLLIWADKKDFSDKGLHTNFKLSSKKEKVTLKDRSGTTLDYISYKKLPQNTSVTTINGQIAYALPSPGRESQVIYSKMTFASEPIFSLPSGFYQGRQTVSLSISGGGTIYYTLDGSKPTKNAHIYSAPLSISESTVVKAIAYQSGTEASEVISQSYIIGLDTTLSVISLSLDDKYLYDDYIGIYVEGKNGRPSQGCYYYLDGDPMNFNQDWERPVFIEYFDKQNQNAFNIAAELSISGQCSRYNRYGKRSFSVELDDTLTYMLYEDKPTVDENDDFKIRAGGYGYNVSDIIATKLVKSGNLNIDYQAATAVQMLMNGEYWGIYNIREKKGKDFIKANYPDVNTKKLDIIAHVGDGDIAKEGDTVAFNALVDFVSDHDISSSTNYQQLQEMIDIENYIDYMSLMLYSGNSDWIYNNTRFWREQKDGAKWRWMLDDLDDGFMKIDFDSFDLAKRTSTFMSKLFNKLLTNSSFKQAFKARFNSLLDSTFSASNILVIINALSDERREYFELERSKWGLGTSTFDSYINKTRDFSNNRVDYVRNKLNNL